MLTTTDQAWRNVLENFDKRPDFFPNLQNVHTPFILGEEMLDKLTLYAILHPTSTYCTLNLTFVQLLIERGILRTNITFVTDCREKAEICRRHSKLVGVNVIHDDYLSWSTIMKFDVIVGNPPYQTKSDFAHKNSQALWDEFVKKSFDLCKDGGYVCLVHPSGWRNIKGVFSPVKDLILSKDVKYLEMHNQPDGVKMFGVKTDYDWYVIHNSPTLNQPIPIRGQDGNDYSVNISNLKFIPNGMFDKIMSLVAKDGEELVNLLYDASGYHTQKEWMSQEKSSKFKYPCAYTVMKKGIKFRYSSTNENGHFGIPKFIWGNGEIEYIGSEIDADGQYALTQFCYGILDEPKNLPHIKKAFDSLEFKNLMNMCAIGTYSINYKIMALFRKDFWKQFIN